jgi:hypothetical protein
VQLHRSFPWEVTIKESVVNRFPIVQRNDAQHTGFPIRRIGN